jgi:hypothetical protein
MEPLQEPAVQPGCPSGMVRSIKSQFHMGRIVLCVHWLSNTTPFFDGVYPFALACAVHRVSIRSGSGAPWRNRAAVESHVAENRSMVATSTFPVIFWFLVHNVEWPPYVATELEASIAFRRHRRGRRSGNSSPRSAPGQINHEFCSAILVEQVCAEVLCATRKATC